MNTLHYENADYVVADWLTLKAYADKYGINEKTLFGQVKRGVIPVGDVLEIPEWNLRLVRDVPPPTTRRGPKGGGRQYARFQVVHGPDEQWHLIDNWISEVVATVAAQSQAEARQHFQNEGLLPVTPNAHKP